MKRKQRSFFHFACHHCLVTAGIKALKDEGQGRRMMLLQCFRSYQVPCPHFPSLLTNVPPISFSPADSASTRASLTRVSAGWGKSISRSIHIFSFKKITPCLALLSLWIMDLHVTWCVTTTIYLWMQLALTMHPTACSGSHGSLYCTDGNWIIVLFLLGLSGWFFTVRLVIYICLILVFMPYSQFDWSPASPPLPHFNSLLSEELWFRCGGVGNTGPGLLWEVVSKSRTDTKAEWNS